MVPSFALGIAPVRISSLRRWSSHWTYPHSLIQSSEFAPPRACVPAKRVLVSAESYSWKRTENWLAFERSTMNRALSSLIRESYPSATMFLSFCRASSCVLSMSEICLAVVQQSWSVQMMPSNVENPSWRAFRITMRLSP